MSIPAIATHTWRSATHKSLLGGGIAVTLKLYAPAGAGAVLLAPVHRRERRRESCRADGKMRKSHGKSRRFVGKGIFLCGISRFANTLLCLDFGFGFATKLLKFDDLQTKIPHFRCATPWTSDTATQTDRWSHGAPLSYSRRKRSPAPRFTDARTSYFLRTLIFYLPPVTLCLSVVVCWLQLRCAAAARVAAVAGMTALVCAK